MSNVSLKWPKKGCDLAVLTVGKSYFIVVTNIVEHGDSHAKDNFSVAVRKRKIIGELKDGKFYVTYFKLVKEEKSK